MYNNIYENLTICEILEMSKKMLQYNSAYFDTGVDKTHYQYFIWQTRKKISDIMLNMENPIFQVTYDALVHRESYLNYVYKTICSTITYGLTPHELNTKREKKMEEEEKGIKDVPVSGYDNFGIVKYNINMKIDNTSIEYLRNRVAADGKISVFLWYDFTNNNKNLNIPIITW